MLRVRRLPRQDARADDIGSAIDVCAIVSTDDGADRSADDGAVGAALGGTILESYERSELGTVVVPNAAPEPAPVIDTIAAAFWRSDAASNPDAVTSTNLCAVSRPNGAAHHTAVGPADFGTLRSAIIATNEAAVYTAHIDP